MVAGRAWWQRLPDALALLAVLAIAAVLAAPFYEDYRERVAVDGLLARYDAILARYQAATREGPVASCDALQRALEADESQDWGMLDIGFQRLPGAQADAYRPVVSICAAAAEPSGQEIARLARSRFHSPAVTAERGIQLASVISYAVALSPAGRVGCIGHPSLPPRPCAGIPPLPGRSVASRELLAPGR
ncbi:MAG: hypothetical protein KDG55_03010 [Rhodocyclaceae bacterium]|nr:hypothetical protein [Rhodocyclaceae bacterium]